MKMTFNPNTDSLEFFSCHQSLTPPIKITGTISEMADLRNNIIACDQLQCIIVSN